MSKASIEALHELHGLLASDMAKKIRAGDMTAAEWSAISKFLKDNHIEQLAVAGSPMQSLVDSLPFPTTGIEH